MELNEMKEDEILSEAIKQGYNPEYEGTNKKTPKEFLEVSFSHNKMLKERNEMLSTQIDELNNKLNRVVQFQTEQKNKAVEKAIKELKAQRREAIKEGDHEKIDEIDEEISKQSVAQNDNNIILEAWLSKNPWYKEDEDLAIEADLIADNLSRTGRFQNTQADYEKLLKQVESRIKKLFSEKFKNPKKDNPPEVESGRASPQSDTKKTFADLPSDAKKECENFVAEGLMSKEDYLALYEWD